jgi:hypothetical protein
MLMLVEECQNKTKELLKQKFFEMFNKFVDSHADFTVDIDVLYALFEKQYPIGFSFRMTEELQKEIESEFVNNGYWVGDCNGDRIVSWEL